MLFKSIESHICPLLLCVGIRNVLTSQAISTKSPVLVLNECEGELAGSTTSSFLEVPLSLPRLYHLPIQRPDCLCPFFPQNTIDFEAFQKVKTLDLPHVAKVLHCISFAYEEQLFYAVLEEEHVKTMEDEMSGWNETHLSSDELERIIRTLYAALSALLEQGLIYPISQESVLICPSFVYKLGRIWTCFTPSPANLSVCIENSIAQFRSFSKSLIARFPFASSLSLWSFLCNLPRISLPDLMEMAAKEGENPCGEMETVLKQLPSEVGEGGGSVFGRTVNRKMQKAKREPRPVESRSCECRIS